MSKACQHSITFVMSGKTYCDTCGAVLSGRATVVTATVTARPAGKRILNVHGHGARIVEEDRRFILPTNVEVAFWVGDGGLFGDQARSFSAGGSPTDPAFELIAAGTECMNYETWALGVHDAQNLPTGAAAHRSPIPAVQYALRVGESALIISTGRMGLRGVNNLERICLTLNQVLVPDTSLRGRDVQWRVNWVCCRERLE